MSIGKIVFFSGLLKKSCMKKRVETVWCAEDLAELYLKSLLFVYVQLKKAIVIHFVSVCMS